MNEKDDPTICSIQEIHFRPEDIRRLKVKGGKKDTPYKNNQKRAGVALLISDKIDFKPNCYKRQKNILYVDKRFNSPRKYGNYKHVHQRRRDLKNDTRGTWVV